ncbi:pirin family protein [Geomonas sp. Red32]|uniref:pirin family protein n=1 Tax=Geomonas sp. Red32 TaxID=2912856 RepID=UPI00202CD97C|nr:pirin family protein [Geomonas sp. Red32]MCM0082433.1 pirin family protein [Geomonas sp. Red32]
MSSDTGSIRKIRKVWKSKPTLEGAGVHLKRAFGNNQVPNLDPFLLLDDFRSDTPEHYLKGFPWHPHRGIETITYVLDGRVEHGDSMGNRGVIGPGDLQWMTAGSGIIHQEMPKGDDEGRMYGFQLWANLPASHKMMDPRYRGLTADEIPEARLKDARVKVIAGQIGGVRGPIRDVVVDPEYLDVTLPEQTTFTHAIRRGYTAFAYVIDGHGYFDLDRNPYAHEMVGNNYFDLERSCECGSENLVLYEDGDAVAVSTQGSPVRFLLISGKPIGEPVAWYGPIVMNTQEELEVAFREYQEGTFIKHR